MTHYSRKIEMPKTRKDGLCNFVQMVINQLEAGNTNEALLIAVDLLDTISGDASPFSSITADGDNKLLDEMKRQHAKAISEAIAKAHAQGVEEGKRAQKAALASLLGLAA